MKWVLGKGRTRRRVVRLVAWWALLVGCWGSAVVAGERPAGGSDDAEGVEVVFLANEGFLLRPAGGGDSVLIDAFVREEYSIYGALPRSVADRLESAEAPFHEVRLVLASHVHRDHFQPQPASKFLAAEREAVFATSSEVLEALEEAAEVDFLPDQLRAIPFELGTEERVDVGALRAEVLPLEHASLEHFGHLIHVGGRTVLHIGDAAEDPAQFAGYRLSERGIDVALIPYWYFFEEGSRKLLAAHMSAALTIAAHIPPAELEGVREALAESHPKVVVPSKALELWSY